MRSMYNSFNDGSKITLWCDGRSQSADAGRSEGESAPKTRKLMHRMCHHSVTADDDEVYKKLKAKYPDMANPKLRFWAMLISRGRYDDYDNIPPIPLLQDGSSGSKRNNLSDALVDAAVAFAQLYRSSHVTSELLKRATTSTRISSK